MATTNRLSHRRGFSLLEAMLALFIGGLVLASLGLTLIYAQRTLRKDISYQQVHQNALVGMRKLAEDLTCAHIYSVFSVSNTGLPAPWPGDNRQIAPASGVNVTFLSALNVSNDPQRSLYSYSSIDKKLEFRTWVAYRRNTAGELIRSEQATGPVTLHPSPNFPAAPSLVAFSGDRVVTRGVSNFTVETDWDAPQPSCVNVTLDVQDTYQSGRANRLRFQTRVRVHRDP